MTETEIATPEPEADTTGPDPAIPGAEEYLADEARAYPKLVLRRVDPTPDDATRSRDRWEYEHDGRTHTIAVSAPLPDRPHRLKVEYGRQGIGGSGGGFYLSGTREEAVAAALDRLHGTGRWETLSDSDWPQS